MHFTSICVMCNTYMYYMYALHIASQNPSKRREWKWSFFL